MSDQTREETKGGKIAGNPSKPEVVSESEISAGLTEDELSKITGGSLKKPDQY